MIIGIKEATEKGYSILSIPGFANLSYPSSKSRRGRVQNGGGGICPTITTVEGVCKIVEAHIEDYLFKDFGVFKLTPRECGRLMGVRNADLTKMLNANSNSQVYKQVGNSIVVTVLMALFSQLDIQGTPKWNDLTQTEREEWVERCE